MISSHKQQIPPACHVKAFNPPYNIKFAGRAPPKYTQLWTETSTTFVQQVHAHKSKMAPKTFEIGNNND